MYLYGIDQTDIALLDKYCQENERMDLIFLNNVLLIEQYFIIFVLLIEHYRYDK